MKRIGHRDISTTQRNAHFAPNYASRSILAAIALKLRSRGSMRKGQIGDKMIGFRIRFGRLLHVNAAGVAKLAYAADSKSAGVHSPWGFKSLLRHSQSANQ